MAQALFKSWFVDFDPVWAKKEGRQPFGMGVATAALFPNEFEESELGLIPKGWRVGSIGDIFTSIRNSTDPSVVDPCIPYIGLEHMPQQSIALGRWSKAGVVQSSKLQFNRDDWADVTNSMRAILRGLTGRERFNAMFLQHCDKNHIMGLNFPAEHVVGFGSPVWIPKRDCWKLCDESANAGRDHHFS